MQTIGRSRTRSHKWEPRAPGKPTAVSRVSADPNSAFGTRHLILWVSCSAIYLAVIKALAPQQPPGMAGILISALQAMGFGAAWAGAVVVFSRRSRTRRRVPREPSGRRYYESQPGQWLLVIAGGRLAAEVGMQFISTKVIAAPGAIVSVLTCCLLMAPLLSRKTTALWKLLFSLQLLLFLTPLLTTVARQSFQISLPSAQWMETFLIQWRAPLGIALLLATCIAEHFRGRRFGWLHWSGVVVWLWMLASLWITR